MMNIIIILTIAGILTGSAANEGDLCDLQNDNIIPLGDAGVKNCSIIAHIFSVLTVECRPPLQLINTTLDSILHITAINSDTNITVANGALSHTLVTNDAFLSVPVNVQCGFCIQNQYCNLQQPSYLSDSVSILVFGDPQFLSSNVNGLSVTLNWSPPQFSTLSFPISYKVLISTFVNSSIAVQFNFETSETDITFRNCELLETFAVNQMYQWSVIAVVGTDYIGLPAESELGFTFNRTTPCIEDSIRLIDGANCNQGRVEVCDINGEWGTVCDDFWDDLTSIVACNSLGIPGVADVSYFGPGTGTILLDDVRCFGSETSIFDCSHSNNTDNCSHNEDVGIVCGIAPQCINGDIRLVGSTQLNQGRIEVCRSNVWGTVCDDFFGPPDATVACRQLGFPGLITFYTNAAVYGPGDGAIILDNLDCTGNESSLFECNYSPLRDCLHTEDTGVVCVPECTYGDLRLVNGDTQSEGVVEMCFNNGWGTVCDNDWSNNNAMVVCNQLDIISTNAVTSNKFVLNNTSQTTHMLQFDCTGLENAIVNCIFFALTTCSDPTPVGVICNMEETDQSSSSQIYTSHVTNTVITVHVTSEITTTNLQTSTAITTVSITTDLLSSLVSERVLFGIIGVSTLVAFTILNIFIISITCYVLRKKHNTARKRSTISQAELLSSDSRLSHNGKNYTDPDPDQPAQSYESSARERTDTDYYDTIRVDSFIDDDTDNEPGVLLYNSLYETTKHDELQKQQQLEEEEDYSTVPLKDEAANTDIDSHQSTSATKRENVVSFRESVGYSSIYNYPVTALISPQQSIEATTDNTVSIRIVDTHSSTSGFCIEPIYVDDGVIMPKLENFSMTSNDAYNLGSTDCHSAESDTTSQRSTEGYSQSAANLLPVVHNDTSLIDDEMLDDNPLYQSYSDITGKDTSLIDDEVLSDNPLYQSYSDITGNLDKNLNH